MTEYANSRNIDHFPAFIYKAVSQRLKYSNLKFDIRLPSTTEEAENLDRDNNNTLWYDAIEKENCHDRS